MKKLIALLLFSGIALAQQYPAGTVLRLTAVPDLGARFVGWSNDVTSTENPLTITITADTAITATFEPIPIDPPDDPTLTVTVVGPGSVTVEVVPDIPPPSGDYSAELICPDGAGGYAVTTVIPNDPLADGCYAKPLDVAPFFTAQPYECANLKPGLFYLGLYSFDDGGSITGRKCVDVRVPEDYQTIREFGPREQMVALIHNDLAITDFGTQMPYLSNHGELLILGIPDALGRPRTFSRPAAFQGPILNWQARNGNVAVVNAVNVGMIIAGSASLTPKQTITLVGVTNQTDTRLIIVAYEGGGGNVPSDPMLPINEEVYFKNVLTGRSRNSHNIYLDRNYLHYIEGLVSYGNYGNGNHAIKTEARHSYVYGSYLSAVGVHDNLADDFAGQTPLSSLMCGTMVAKDNKFVVAQNNGAGGTSTVSDQIRVAIASCDNPAGWYSNRYPTSPYTGPVIYNGAQLPTSPYWDPAWWNGIDDADVYGSPDLLRRFYIGNQMVAIANGTSFPSHMVGVLGMTTFPATYNSYAEARARFTEQEPPREWKERTRIILANNCMTGGGNLTRINWGGTLTCTWATNPAWVATWPGCVAGETTPDTTDYFVLIGSNECGVEDPLPQEALDAIAALEALPNPPWRHWQ